MRRALATAGVATSLACAVFAASVSAPPPAALAQDPLDIVGKPATPFAAVDVVGARAPKHPIRPIDDFRGRCLLLVFIDTRNGRVAEAVPALNKLVDSLGARGLTVLAVSEEERAPVETWTTFKKPKFGTARVDTATIEMLRKAYPYPGMPWGFVIDPDGVVRWAGHPQGLAEKDVTPHLERVSKPPELPATLADAQAAFDDGRFAAARTLLSAAADSGKLDRTDAKWARDTVAWIDRRRPVHFAEIAELEAKAWWWDAWERYTDFQRRFEGLDLCAEAKAKAEAIRKDPKAAQDLTDGDDYTKAVGFAKEGKLSPARLILERLSKLKNSRFGARAKDALAALPAKK
ncbi:MAG: hypothetical protein HMLKMBBP_03818 [Planctomycetes bacterium]|nr:hypothetical protein [Planctomycetota bacterium]